MTDFKELIVQLIPMVSPLVWGSITTLLVEVAKRVQAIPVSRGQTFRLRVLAGGCSIALTLVTAYLNGTLASESTVNVAIMSLQTVASWLFSHVLYHGVVKTSQDEQV